MSRIESFSALQVQTDEWRRRNFDEASRAPFKQLAGMVEELGEVAHALLKLDQGIRGNEGLRGKEIDAVGDLVIYLCGYCSARDIYLFECINRAWDEVKDRDWIKYPETGRPPDPDPTLSIEYPG